MQKLNFTASEWVLFAALVLVALSLIFTSCVPAQRGPRKSRYELSRGMWGGQP